MVVQVEMADVEGEPIGEMSLVAAVIGQAILDYVFPESQPFESQFAGRAARVNFIKAAAHRYLFGDIFGDHQEPWSFIWCCSLLGLDYVELRRKLKCPQEARVIALRYTRFSVGGCPGRKNLIREVLLLKTQEEASTAGSTTGSKLEGPLEQGSGENNQLTIPLLALSSTENMLLEPEKS